MSYNSTYTIKRFFL